MVLLINPTSFRALQHTAYSPTNLPAISALRAIIFSASAGLPPWSRIELTGSASHFPIHALPALPQRCKVTVSPFHFS